METKTIYDLKLHESTFIDGIGILRVAGGWIYSWSQDIFVPYSEEFEIDPDNEEKF